MNRALVRIVFDLLETIGVIIMADLSDATKAAIADAFTAKAAADQSTTDHNTAVANLQTAEQAEQNTAAAELTAHKAALDKANSVLQDVATDLGITLPTTVTSPTAPGSQQRRR